MVCIFSPGPHSYHDVVITLHLTDDKAGIEAGKAVPGHRDSDSGRLSQAQIPRTVSCSHGLPPDRPLTPVSMPHLQLCGSLTDGAFLNQVLGRHGCRFWFSHSGQRHYPVAASQLSRSPSSVLSFCPHHTGTAPASVTDSLPSLRKSRRHLQALASVSLSVATTPS